MWGGRGRAKTEDETDQTNWRSRRISGAAFFVVWIRGLVRSTTEEAGMRKGTDIRKDLLRSLARPEVTLERMEPRDGSIVSHWRISGRNVRGVPTLGIEPTDRTLNVKVITVDSVVGGVAHTRTLIDLSSLMAPLEDNAEA